jgi:DNA-binding response OmpR family regulator
MSAPLPGRELLGGYALPVGRILLVDDDGDLVAVMGELLREAGALGCVEARSLRDVQLHRAEALGCEVAIVDVNLGSGQPSGVDVCLWLRREGFSGRIVFLTGHAQSNPLVAAAVLTAGASVLVKPVRAEDLVRVAVGGT